MVYVASFGVFHLFILSLEAKQLFTYKVNSLSLSY